MSYILDALRRSQAERDRGQVPGLNAQPGAATASSLRVSESPVAPWLLAAVVGLAVAAALLAWWWLGEPSGSRPASTPLLPPLQAPQAQSAATAPTPPPAMAGTVAPPLVVSAPPAAPPVPAIAVATPALTAAKPVAPAAPPSAPAPRALSLAELSADQRRELPSMAMGGSIWSENTLSRFVIVNGQVVREGDQAAAGVTVERIGPKTVLLKWRGLRLEVPI